MTSDKSNITTAPELAVDLLGEKLGDEPRSMNEIAAFVADVALPCAFEACDPEICGVDLEVCAKDIAFEASTTMVQILTRSERHDSKLKELLTLDSFKEKFDDLQAKRKDGDRLLVMFLDLDHFKQTNARLGHDGADKVLHALSSKLVNTVRSNDKDMDLIARYGGEEFVIAANVGDADDEEITEFIRRVQSPLIMNRDSEDEAYTSSVGVVYAEPNEHVASVIKKSNQAMYTAKRGGRDNAALWQEYDKTPVLIFPSKAA